MKKSLALLLIGVLSLSVLAGCSKPEIKDGGSKPSATDTKKEDKKDDVWTYFNGTKWSEDFKGLKFEIEKAVVTDKAPAEDRSDKLESAVGVKMKITNTTKEKFTTYPDQAVLVTSTGEQIDMPSIIASDHLGGEIDEGVTKEGAVVWYLKKAGTAKDIKWVKLKWDARQGAANKFDSESKEFEIKLELKE